MQHPKYALQDQGLALTIHETHRKGAHFVGHPVLQAFGELHIDGFTM